MLGACTQEESDLGDYISKTLLQRKGGGKMRENREKEEESKEREQ